MFYFHPLLLIPVFSSVTTGLLAWYVYGRRDEPVALKVSILMGILSVWSLAYALQVLAVPVWLKLCFFEAGSVCAYLTSLCFFGITLDVTGRGYWLTRRRVVFVLAATSWDAAASFTSHFHSLYISVFGVVKSGPLLLLDYKFGPLFKFHYLCLNVLLVFSLVLLAVAAFRMRGADRYRPVFLITGTLAPLLVEHLFKSPYNGMRLPTYTFWFSGMCYMLAIRYRLLEVLPIARSKLFESLGNPVLVIDGSGKLADSNEAARELFPPEAGGGLAALDAAASRFPVLGKVLSGASSELRETVPDGDGSGRFWQVSSVPLLRERRGVGTLVQFFDVTALKSAEEAMRRASEAKSDFVAVVSHELRTPLQAVIGFSELAREKGRDGSGPEYLDMIHSSSTALLDIVNDLLDYSRIEAGGMELDSVRFDLRAMLNDMSMTHSHMAKRKGIGFVLEVSEDVPTWVFGDVHRVRQVLTNVVGNAVKFTVRGGVEVQVAAEARGGEAGPDAPETFTVRFTVRDTGIGIPAARQGQVFESFAQAAPAITRRFGGSGLGAAIARRLARLMGGDVTFESAEGSGSVFFVEIPLSRAPEPAYAAFRAVDSAPRSLTVLVAEDNGFNRRLLQDALEHFGHRAILAEDGAQALDRWREGGVDLVLMDIMMPDIDGYQTAGRIRAVEAELGLDRTPIYAVTAKTVEGLLVRCVGAGMDGMLSKPVALERLRELLDGVARRPARQPAPRPATEAARGTGPDAQGREPLFGASILGPVMADPVKAARYRALLAADLEREAGNLDGAYAAGDREKLSRAAHAIRGAVLHLNGTDAAALAAELRESAGAGDTERMTRDFGRLRAECARLAALLEGGGADGR